MKELEKGIRERCCRNRANMPRLVAGLISVCISVLNVAGQSDPTVQDSGSKRGGATKVYINRGKATAIVDWIGHVLSTLMGPIVMQISAGKLR